MNILDENIASNQRQLLKSWRFRIYQIGFDFGRRGMLDDQIISLLLRQKGRTFFTRDEDFYRRRLCHRRYCLVHLKVEKNETGIFVRRLLSHPEFDTKTKRMGTVASVSMGGISFWSLDSEDEIHLDWRVAKHLGS